MKLLVFSPYYPPHIGGLESHADEFNKYLSQTRVAITVFTPRLPVDALEFETRHQSVKIIRFPAFEIINNYPLPKFWSVIFWKLFCNLFKEKFDIVISRTRFFNTSLFALAYAKIKKVKWIHIEHGSDFVQLSSFCKTLVAKIYDHLFGRLIFKCSDLNISISQAVQKFVAQFDKRESPIIYRGINFTEIDQIAPDLEFKKRFENKTIIAWAGRLYKWKGVRNSIEAVKNLPQEIKDQVVFIVMGDGEDLPQLKSIADDSILFTGSLPREKVLGILKVADIYLHSSEPGGGLSTSLLEAMYCECAVIATPSEGADEIITDKQNGILIINYSEITPNLISILKNQKQAKIYATTAKTQIKNNFNWQQSISAYAKIFGK